MRYLILALFTFWVWQLAAATDSPNNLPVLEPVYNEAWGKSLLPRGAKRNSTSYLDLREEEQFLWRSPNSTNQSTLASMILYTKDNELVISMERFAHELKSVNCGQNMMLTFKSKAAYEYIMKTWIWVNLNGTRSFIMVANYPGCGKDRSREPWVVSNVYFYNSTLTVHLDATKKTWKEVAHTYTLDFGDFIPEPSTNQRRFLNVNLDKSFTLDLTAQLPTEIFKTPTPNNMSLAIDCIDCGTKGTLVFAGHISASLFDGITSILLSATPHGIEANLKLSFDLSGSLSFEVAGALKVNKKLLTLPLPSGFNIPDILTFGPNVDINAGFSLDNLEGEAKITTGISAKIPDSSVAKIDLVAKHAVDISGWVPQITTDPLTLEAEIDAEVELYTEIAVAVSLLVLDDDGFSVDLGLRVPDVHITADTAYDPNGVCSGSSQPVGVAIDASIGVELAIEGYTDVSGTQHDFLNVPLFSAPDLFDFSPICIPFGTPTGVCLYVPQSNEDATYEASEDTGGVSRRSELTARAPDYKRDPYWISCDSEKTEIRVQQYPAPSSIKRQSKYNVPIIKPLIQECDVTPSCPETDWKVTHGAKSDILSGWATEHVYEGNWVKAYLDHLYKNFFKDSGDVGCKDEVNAFGKTPISINTPDPKSATNYSEALMQNLGTIYTANERLALFSQEQNQKKNLIFAQSDIYGDFKKTSTSNEKRVCEIGKIVTVCEYLNDPDIQKALGVTITALEEVLTAMDNDDFVKDKTPAALKGHYTSEHAAWFTSFYGAGIAHAQAKLKEYADFLIGADDFDKLSADKQQSIHNVSNDPASYCPNRFVHP